MAVRRPIPPPPPRRKQVDEAAISTKQGTTTLADRIANINLNSRRVPPPPARQSADAGQSPLSPGPPPPIPYHTRPTPDQIAQILARYSPHPNPEPEPEPLAGSARRRVPPLPSPLPTPPPESGHRPELSSFSSSAHDQEEEGDAEGGCCIECYDFTAVDHHAAQFPRHTVTSPDDLAYSLTSPFPSETEKARAIFTWLHHNIAYDAASFFSGNLPSQSPSNTLHSGLAVCEGYAGLFSHLAGLAGLQAHKVSGHGKGYGHQSLNPGQPAPRFRGNHAWNCVMMDGEWRLIDACWGAGYLEGSSFFKSFTPRFFTSSPAEFGQRHYPEDPSYQLLSEEDGGPVSWEDYILRPEGPQIASGFYANDLSPMLLQPASKSLPRGRPATFHVFKRCQHMSTAQEDNYAYFLDHGNDQIPLQLNAEGGWSANISSVRGEVKLLSLETFNGNNAKGMSAERFLSFTGARSWSWSGLAVWSVI